MVVNDALEANQPLPCKLSRVSRQSALYVLKVWRSHLETPGIVLEDVRIRGGVKITSPNDATLEKNKYCNIENVLLGGKRKLYTWIRT